MRIEQKNKLIADYMGLEPYEDSRYGTLWSSPVKGETGSNFVLKFNTSWDWLMPVVEKICAFNYYIIIDGKEFYVEMFVLKQGLSTVSFNVRERWSGKIEFTTSSRFNEDIKSDLEAHYYCVLEYIKWYNKNGTKE